MRYGIRFLMPIAVLFLVFSAWGQTTNLLPNGGF